MRKGLLAARLAVPEPQRRAWDTAIAGHLLAWCAAEKIAALGVFWALPGEPELAPAYTALAAAGVPLALPVVLEKHAPLVFAEWTPGEAMLRDKMGVAVPARRRIIDCPPAILVPCLGFNAERLRLGYGGGFYDRTLAQAPRPATLGVAYACQAVVFGGDAHDIALDAMLTENGLLT